MKIAVFLPNWIGDAVMATPALRAIRDHHPEAEIVGVLRPPIGEVLKGTGLVNRILSYQRDRKTDLRSRYRFTLRLRAEAFDTAVLFPNSLRSAYMAFAAGAKRRVGFSRDLRGCLLTDRLTPKPRQLPNPVLEEYLRLAAQLGCPIRSRATELAVTPADQEQFDRFRNSLPGELRHRPLITLNPGGAFGAAKHWPVEHFGELARRFASELGHTVLVLCGPAEQESARAIAHWAGHPHVISLAEQKLSVGLTKAAVRSSDLLVTTDSGPRHFAPPFSVPVVTLFGATHIAWSETFVTNSVHLQLSMPCGPCQQRVCPLKHHRCMVDLTPAMAFDAAVGLLTRSRRRVA